MEKHERCFWILVAGLYFLIIYAFVEINTLIATGVADMIMLAFYFLVLRNIDKRYSKTKLQIMYICGVLVHLSLCIFFLNVSIVGTVISAVVMPLLIPMGIVVFYE